jgi:hypothetical protein
MICCDVCSCLCEFALNFFKVCDEWFHGRCVNVSERDGAMIDVYVCPTCTQAGKGTSMDLCNLTVTGSTTHKRHLPYGGQ